MAKGGRDSEGEGWGVREMRSAEHVLAIIHKAKAEGDSSMVGKREQPEGAYG